MEAGTQNKKVRKRISLTPWQIEKLKELTAVEGRSEFLVLHDVLAAGFDAYEQLGDTKKAVDISSNGAQPRDIELSILALLCFYLKPLATVNNLILTELMEHDAPPVLKWPQGASFSDQLAIWEEVGKQINQTGGAYSGLYAALCELDVNPFDATGANKKQWQKLLDKEVKSKEGGGHGNGTKNA